MLRLCCEKKKMSAIVRLIFVRGCVVVLSVANDLRLFVMGRHVAFLLGQQGGRS